MTGVADAKQNCASRTPRLQAENVPGLSNDTHHIDPLRPGAHNSGASHDQSDSVLTPLAAVISIALTMRLVHGWNAVQNALKKY